MCTEDPKPLTNEDIKSFLKWQIDRDESVTNFGYLLLSGDPQLESETLSLIQKDFKLYQQE